MGKNKGSMIQAYNKMAIVFSFQTYQYMQPGYDILDKDKCVVMVTVNPHESLGWVKIPCDLEIPGSVALCESDPTETYEKPYEEPRYVCQLVHL